MSRIEATADAARHREDDQDISGLQRPLRAWRPGCITTARRRGLRPETRLFGLAHQFGKEQREASQHQEDDDQACYRQYVGLDWLAPTPPIHCRLT